MVLIVVLAAFNEPDAGEELDHVERRRRKQPAPLASRWTRLKSVSTMCCLAESWDLSASISLWSDLTRCSLHCRYCANNAFWSLSTRVFSTATSFVGDVMAMMSATVADNGVIEGVVCCGGAREA